MKIILSLIMILLVAILVIFLIKKRKDSQLKKKQKEYEYLVTKSMRESLGQVKIAGFNGSEVSFDSATISPVAKVWGLNVVVFDYSFSAIDLDKEQVNHIREELKSKLEKFAREKDLTMDNGRCPLVVSDMWSRKGKLNVEVAYLINEETLGYVHDLKRIDNNK